MINQKEKPVVQQYQEHEWEFIFPKSIDDEEVHKEFWNAVDFLGYNDKMAEKTFKKLIKKYPFHIDAYNHLSIAFRNQKKEFESLLTAEKSFNLGKSCLPKSFNYERDNLIWPSLENRPFLRACQIYGLECQYHKKYSEAISLYKLNLALNEDDHQGTRYLLLEIFFATKDFQEAMKLLNKYADDYSIEFKFGTVVLDIIQEDFSQAEKDLKEAIKTNKYFVTEVIKTRHQKPPPFRLPSEPNFDAGIPVGSIQQAYDYWKRNEKLYKTKKIIEFFKRPF